MAIQSDPTVTGFNCFVSASEADNYFASSYFGDSASWDDQADSQEALLISATRRLSSLRWGGTPAVTGQALAFPRQFSVIGEYGYSYYPNVAAMPLDGWVPVDVNTVTSSTVAIPQWIKDATCELARWIWTEGERAATDQEFAQLKSVKYAGALDYQFRDSNQYSNLGPAVAGILFAQGYGIIDLRTGAKSISMVY